MEVVLKAVGPVCAVSGTAFTPGERIVSALVRLSSGEYERMDARAECADTLRPAGEILCRWSHTHRPKPAQADVEREMRLSLESLFLNLYEENPKPEPRNHDLIRFLTLFLERKRILKPRARIEPGWRSYEHARSHQVYAVPEGDLDTAFFLRIQSQLEPLLGASKPPATAAPQQPPPDPAPPAAAHESAGS